MSVCSASECKLYKYVFFWKFQSFLSILDDSIREILVKILNCSFNDAWCQASLPIRFGGLGIRKISSVSLPAFLSSCHSTSHLFNKIIHNSFGSNTQISFYNEAESTWTTACPNTCIPVNSKVQRLWDEPLCKQVHSQLINSCCNLAERARLLAVSERESGYWLQALPSANVGTLLTNTTFSLAIGLRLGSVTNEPHRCVCGVSVDNLGHHGLSCRRSAGRLPRHAAINDVIRRAFATVNVPAILEPKGIVRDDGKRPDGMTLIPWCRGRPLVWDATCVDTLAPTHLQSTARAAGAAASTAEDSKRRKYAAIGDNCIFVPFGVETLGPWGPEAKILYRDLSTRLNEVSGDQRAGSYLGQRISLAIQRGNATSLLGTLPTGSDLSSIFYL